jgi:FkbH-like protein
VQRHVAQKILFAESPSRAAIVELALPKADATQVAINVWRNHNFETLGTLLEPYSLFGRWLPAFRLGAYDDSLSFDGWQPAAAELLWLDSERAASSASSTAWIDWLHERLGELRARSHAPILVATWPRAGVEPAALRAICERVVALYFVDLQELCSAHAVELLDARTAALLGSPISKTAQLLIARELACRTLPALLFPPIKALALDLDETLYAGVLGEDGVTGVRLTAGHRTLQQHLKALRERGVYLSLVSRNELSDVEQLFEVRTDFPLKIQDFSAVEASWDDKALALRRVAEHLRIGLDALLFIDDNTGELAAVSAALPALQTLHAEPQAELTQRALSYYPGMWRQWSSAEDNLRVADMRALAVREALAQRTCDASDYVRSLQVKLTLRHNPIDQLERLSELSLKTNQFNLALKRWGLATLRQYCSMPGCSVVSVQLGDRLSESGVIALLCAHVQKGTLRVQELCISCRALGRRLEHSIVLLALRTVPGFQGCSQIVFDIVPGPRNQPALRWLADVCGATSVPTTRHERALTVAEVNDFEAPVGLTVELRAEGS